MPERRHFPENEWNVIDMNIFVLLIAIIAVVLLFVGGFVQAVQWLLWVGIILLAISVIVWLLRFITGRKNTTV